jgi:UDP-N-acetylglucosamine:LPS N-acetylglucosamine transferase
MTGQRLSEEVNRLAANPTQLEQMGAKARTFAHPNAAQRAADVLEEISPTKGRASHV